MKKVYAIFIHLKLFVIAVEDFSELWENPKKYGSFACCSPLSFSERLEKMVWKFLKSHRKIKVDFFIVNG